MAPALRYLKVILQNDRTESIPVRPRFQIPDLYQEWVEIKSADGSTVVLRSSEVIAMHLTEIKGST